MFSNVYTSTVRAVVGLIGKDQRISSVLPSSALTAINPRGGGGNATGAGDQSQAGDSIRAGFVESKSHGGSVWVSPNTLGFVSGLLWADINGSSRTCHASGCGGWGRPRPLWGETSCEDPEISIEALRKATKLQPVQFISLLMEANVNHCESCPVPGVVKCSYEILRFMFDPPRRSTCWAWWFGGGGAQNQCCVYLFGV